MEKWISFDKLRTSFAIQDCRIVILSALLALFSGEMRAQFDVYFSHYFDMQTAHNPAACGKQNKLNITASYAMALSGFENAPKTIYVSGDMPVYFLKNIHGLGLQLTSDNIGLFTHQMIDAQYAYQHKLWGGKIAAGVTIGLLNLKYSGSDVDVEDTSDPVFKNKTDMNGASLDLGFGLFYQRNPSAGSVSGWHVGIAGQHVTAPTITLGEVNEYDVAATFVANGGVDFQLHNPVLKVSTSAIVRTDLVTYRGDITARLLYTYEKRMFYGGVTYSPTNSVTALLGGNFHGVLFGYSYEFFTNGISLKNGTHELFVGYQMDVDVGKKQKNRHQTTRTL